MFLPFCSNNHFIFKVVQPTRGPIRSYPKLAAASVLDYVAVTHSDTSVFSIQLTAVANKGDICIGNQVNPYCILTDVASQKTPVNTISILKVLNLFILN